MPKKPQPKRGKNAQKSGSGAAKAAAKAPRDGRASRSYGSSATGGGVSERSAGGATRGKGKTLVLSGTPKRGSRAPEIRAELEGQGRYFGDSGTRTTRQDRDSH